VWDHRKDANRAKDEKDEKTAASGHLRNEAAGAKNERTTTGGNHRNEATSATIRTFREERMAAPVHESSGETGIARSGAMRAR
jgi:hypothetical protein